MQVHANESEAFERFASTLGRAQEAVDGVLHPGRGAEAHFYFSAGPHQMFAPLLGVPYPRLTWRRLALPEGETPEAWAVRRRKRHEDRHVIFNVRLIWDRWLQISEHRTANGGTVIIQTDVTERKVAEERYSYQEGPRAELEP